MVHELVRYMKSMNMHGEKIKVHTCISAELFPEPVADETPCIQSVCAHLHCHTAVTFVQDNRVAYLWILKRDIGQCIFV